MKCLPALVFTASALTAFASAQANSDAPIAPAATQAATNPRDFAVYVDRETRFAFIKTPHGWTFVRQIDADKLAQVARGDFVRVDQRPFTLLALAPR